MWYSIGIGVKCNYSENEERQRRFRRMKGIFAADEELKMFGIRKRNSLAGIVVLLISIAMMAGGCSATEEAAMAGDLKTNDIEEKAAENTEESSAAAPGVYAEMKRSDKTVEITPVPGGITDSTVLPTFNCTFGDMTNEAQNALEEGRVFPKEFFRDLTACMLISEENMAGKEHDAIMYSLSTLAAMANEFWSLDPGLRNVVYEVSDDGYVAKSVYNVHFGSGDKDGQIIYDNQARKWYLGDAEYSGSIDSKETLAVWWTVFDVANGNVQ